jgi:hypothetical protein
MAAFPCPANLAWLRMKEANLKKYPFAGGTVPMTFVFHQDGSAAAL